MTKTHWRTIAGKEYLVGEELLGKEVPLTIKEVKIEELQNQKGKENKPVASFEGTERKLVLNITNMKTIAKVLGTPFTEEWAGKQITLIPVSGRFFGEDQIVVRIKQDYSSIKPRT
jgi:tRNA splicing ligase